LSEKDILYERAYRKLARRLNSVSAGSEEALPAFIEATHKNSPTGLPHFWWCGVYLLTTGNPSTGEAQLELAASSSPACSPLPVRPRDGGVCSDCALIEKPIVVPDVSRYPGHVECNPSTRSEIVVPLFSVDGRLAGVIDIDSDKPGSFDQADASWISLIADLLAHHLAL